MPIGPARMSLWDHLSELRRRLTVVVVAIIVVACVAYLFSPQIGMFLLHPVAANFPNPDELPLEELVQQTVALEAFTPFGVRFFISFISALVATTPIWIWQLLAFFLPALKPSERKWVVPTFFVAVALFCVGIVFCYLVILDPAFGWLLEQAQGFTTVLPEINSYIHTILLFEIAFGFAFELPLVVFYLTLFNIVPYKKLRASWRVVYVVLMVFCAVVTPDANPVTMILMFCAMSVLYEASLLLSRIALSRRLARQKAAEAAEAES
ncbi:MAG: twin-arginine translocase subunit TatC [Coriobacteriales bacterium]|jgi:sec-independent protein translocase protein TatC|nr:twin-arginine translocase subunit TatC [Coriobacteriales bacterium]